MARGRWRRWLLLVTLVLGVGVLSACRPAEEASRPQPSTVVKRFGADPLTVELRLDRQHLTVAERLTLLLRAETEEGQAVTFNGVKEFPGFAVASQSEGKPELSSPGRVAHSFQYVLEPLAAGSFQIPVLTVEAWKKAEANAAVTTVSTEPLPVTVDSLLAKDDSGATISDIAPPLAKPLNRWLLGGGGLAVLLALALCVTLLRRRGRRVTPPPPPLPPHLLAYQALDRLLAADLLITGQVKEFYAALSDILRHYIEQRFGLRAPEQTTEEFLAELGRVSGGPMNRSGGASVISPSHTLLLRDFLGHCDLVKFAKHTPAGAEAEESVERCRCFVRETEPVAVSDHGALPQSDALSLSRKRLQGAPDARKRPANYTPVCEQAADKADGVSCDRLPVADLRPGGEA